MQSSLNQNLVNSISGQKKKSYEIEKIQILKSTKMGIASNECLISDNRAFFN